MRLTTIFYLYRVRLRARLVQELLAVIGISVGVGLLFASQVANTSLSSSVASLANGLVGRARLQIVARDPQGFDERLLSDVQQLQGVQLVAPVLERSVTIVGSNEKQATVDLVGVNSRFIQLQGPLLAQVSTERLSQQHGLALPAPIAETLRVKSLQPLTIQVGAKNIKTILAVELNRAELGSAVESPVAIAPLAEAQRLTGMMGRVTRLLVEPAPGHDAQVENELKRVAGGLENVRPANFDASVFNQAESPTVQSTELFSAISALVGFLFAFNAMLLTVPQRRNLIHDLRMDGYTPAEILEVMLFDVFILGVVGTLIGLGLGDLLSRSLFQAQPGYLSLAFPVGSRHIVSWQSVTIAAVGGLMAAVVGVVFPLRREIFGYHSLGSHRTATPRWIRFGIALAGGLLCAGLTTVLVLGGIDSVEVAVLAFASLTLSLLFMLPIAFSGTITAIDRLQRPVMGVSSRIAIIELLSSTTRARSLAIAATGAVAVFGSVAIEGAHGNLRDGLARSAAALSRGTDIWVSPLGRSTTLATVSFEDRYRKVLEELPSVSKVVGYRGGFLDIGTRRVLVLAPPKTDARLVSANQLVSGRLGFAMDRLRQTGWLTMSQDLAKERHLHVGDQIIFPSPRQTPFRVAAITTNFGWSPGTIVMNAGDFARAWASDDVSAYQITLKPGMSLEDGLEQIRSRVLPGTSLVAQSASQHEHNEIAGQRQGLSRLTDISVLVLVAAAFAMAAAMGAMLWQRRPRLAGMKVDGFGQGELWGALLWESALLLGTGCSVGAVFGLYGQLVLSHALVSVTGFPVVSSIGIPAALISFAIVTAIALVMVALPGYLAVQVKPALQD
jgi:putative ABC transport system permease protein